MKKRTGTVAAVVAAALFSVSAQAEDPIRIGAINPYSGPLALYGDELARGYELAVNEANANGGVLGRQVELIRGDAANPQQAQSAVTRLAEQEDVDAFIGTYISGVANVASDSALRYEKIYWDTNALAANLTERGLPNFIRSGPYAGSFARGSVEAFRDFIAPRLGKSPEDLTVWLEHEDSIYGTSIAEIQKAALEEIGVTVVGVGGHSFRSVDLNDSILRAKAENPDVWINTGYVPDTNLLLRTARTQEFEPAAMMTVGTGDTFETLDSVGEEYLDGILVVSYPRPDVAPEYGPGSRDFLEAYRAAYERDPIAPQAMTAYVGAQILLEAIEAAGSTDMHSIREAAAAMDKPMNTYANGFGVQFDDSMQNTRTPPTVIQWQGGEQITVFPPEAASGEAIDLGRP